MTRRGERVTYGEYLTAVALTLARRHRPLWLVNRCACGAILPCHATHRIPISRDHWPRQEDTEEQEQT
ncbi:hypothetical protein AB0J86_26305 [Micromonospora sp. NPDC049559]|uniref:hypothetical protein n=1 Tax=Micromonospora sp. NPDC049559 TaxID=3155923 RepID=UPI003427B004